jgi:hypothetical protein
MTTSKPQSWLLVVSGCGILRRLRATQLLGISRATPLQTIMFNHCQSKSDAGLNRISLSFQHCNVMSAHHLLARLHASARDNQIADHA